MAKDGRVFHVERLGALKLCQPGLPSAKVLGKLTVFETLDNGLLGLTLEPDFLRNGWLYLFYSPVGVNENRVARFRLNGDVLDLASEKILLRIPVQREQPVCHTGGSMTFDAQGNLYISTGDNVNPFASDGFSPSDERPGRAPWDAQGHRGTPQWNSLATDRSAGRDGFVRLRRISPPARPDYLHSAGS